MGTYKSMNLGVDETVRLDIAHNISVGHPFSHQRQAFPTYHTIYAYDTTNIAVLQTVQNGNLAVEGLK